MPAFKPKTYKYIQIDAQSMKTMDTVHKEKQFEHKEIYEKEIPELDSLIKSLKREYTKTKNRSGDISLLLELKDKIKSLKQNKQKLLQKRDNYYLDNSKSLFDYFETKKSIASGTSTKRVLNSFFNIKSKPQEENESKIKRNLIKKYFSNIDESHINVDDYIVNIDKCTYCNIGEIIPIDFEGVYVCNHCSRQTQLLTENEKPSYKEPPKEACFYAYKRINHFREILAQFQAKETTQIPEEVIINIKKQIKKERINIEQLNNKKAKEVLKKLGYNKYYEHIPFIKEKLGIRPPVMSPELEEKLCNLFMDIQAPYSKYCPDDRVNFLNYYYTVSKLCELLDQKQFLPYFPMLKDREKRIEQDEIWKKICDELDWEFIPTV